MLTINGKRITLDSSVAEDLAQEALLRAHMGGYVIERTPQGWVGTHASERDLAITLVVR